MLDCILISGKNLWTPAQVRNSLETFQKSVGGYVENIFLSEKGIVLLVDEDGRCKGRELTCRVKVFPHYGTVLCGPVLVLGWNGDYCSVPSGIEQQMDTLFSFDV